MPSERVNYSFLQAAWLCKDHNTGMLNIELNHASEGTTMVHAVIGMKYVAFETDCLMIIVVVVVVVVVIIIIIIITGLFNRSYSNTANTACKRMNSSFEI
jgi:hypothetical protein